MPVPPAPQPSGVRLFIEGARFEVLDYSSAGVTVPGSVLGVHQDLRRGAPFPATIQVFGEMYGVILRLAASGPKHAEFAFVSLAPQARRALEHYAVERSAEGTGAHPLRLAFAQAVEAVVPAGRRLAMPESEPLYTLTVARQRADSRPSASMPSLSAPAVPPSPGTLVLTGRDLLGLAALALGVLSALWWALA